MNVELRQLRYFVAVAEELNFTRAAEQLHIAQQPLSAAIARLESQLGARLLDRTTRRVTLTEAGTALLEPARAALLAADAAVDAVRAVARGEAGEVAMGLSAGAWYGLGELFEAIQEQHPGPPATFPLDLLWQPSPTSELRPAVERVIDVALATARQHHWIA